MSGTTIQQDGAVTAIAASDGRLTLSVPSRLQRRSGRKQMKLPNGVTRPTRAWDREPTPLQVALARGHQWLALLQSGAVRSMRELAASEGVDTSYVSRMVNLTLLSPEIVARILDDDLPDHLVLFDLAVDPPAVWTEQWGRVGFTRA